MMAWSVIHPHLNEPIHHDFSYFKKPGKASAPITELINARNLLWTYTSRTCSSLTNVLTKGLWCPLFWWWPTQPCEDYAMKARINGSRSWEWDWWVQDTMWTWTDCRIPDCPDDEETSETATTRLPGLTIPWAFKSAIDCSRLLSKSFRNGNWNGVTPHFSSMRRITSTDSVKAKMGLSGRFLDSRDAMYPRRVYTKIASAFNLLAAQPTALVSDPVL